MKINLSAIAESQKRIIVALLASALLGAIWFVMVRAVLVDANGPHFHANFALYVDGEQELFDRGIFYEEVASCGSGADDPKTRVHLHDYVPDVVHVHDASATWGNFFENLGFTLGNNILYENAGTHVSGQTGELSFILNGQPVQSIANKTIQSEDALLISFGNESAEELTSRYESIVRNAAEYNLKADPSACSGSQSVAYWDRVKLVLGLD